MTGQAYNFQKDQWLGSPSPRQCRRCLNIATWIVRTQRDIQEVEQVKAKAERD